MIGKKGSTIEDSAAGQQGILRIAVLVSGSGSNLQALIDAIESKKLVGVEIAAVISNRADAYGLQRALQHQCPTFYIPWTKKTQQENAEARILQILHLFDVDLIVLAGWLRIFSPDFIMQFPQRIINLHPALLPDDRGDSYITNDGIVIPALRGLHVVKQAIEAKLPTTGSTVHYVIPEVDAGPVIARVEISITPDDTEETLHERLKEQEHHLIVEAVRSYTKQVGLLVPQREDGLGFSAN
jgi:phosphoribosylglycinamide formyltransferase 1